MSKDIILLLDIDHTIIPGTVTTKHNGLHYINSEGTDNGLLTLLAYNYKHVLMSGTVFINSTTSRSLIPKLFCIYSLLSITERSHRWFMSVSNFSSFPFPALSQPVSMPDVCVQPIILFCTLK